MQPPRDEQCATVARDSSPDGGAVTIASNKLFLKDRQYFQIKFKGATFFVPPNRKRTSRQHGAVRSATAQPVSNQQHGAALLTIADSATDRGLQHSSAGFRLTAPCFRPQTLADSSRQRFYQEGSIITTRQALSAATITTTTPASSSCTITTTAAACNRLSNQVIFKSDCSSALRTNSVALRKTEKNQDLHIAGAVSGDSRNDSATHHTSHVTPHDTSHATPHAINCFCRVPSAGSEVRKTGKSSYTFRTTPTRSSPNARYQQHSVGLDCILADFRPTIMEPGDGGCPDERRNHDDDGKDGVVGASYYAPMSDVSTMVKNMEAMNLNSCQLRRTTTTAGNNNNNNNRPGYPAGDAHHIASAGGDIPRGFLRFREKETDYVLYGTSTETKTATPGGASSKKRDKVKFEQQQNEDARSLCKEGMCSQEVQVSIVNEASESPSGGEECQQRRRAPLQKRQPSASPNRASLFSRIFKRSRHGPESGAVQEANENWGISRPEETGPCSNVVTAMNRVGGEVQPPSRSRSAKRRKEKEAGVKGRQGKSPLDGLRSLFGGSKGRKLYKARKADGSVVAEKQGASPPAQDNRDAAGMDNSVEC